MVDKITMDNYAFGNYNSFTLKLKQLVERVEKNEAEINNEKELALRKKQIIKKAKKGIILNDEARKIYLEYLQDSKKFSVFDIKEYFFNLEKDLFDAYLFVDDVIWDNIWPFCKFSKSSYLKTCLALGLMLALVELAVLVEIFIFIPIKWLYSLLISLLPLSTFLVPITTFLGALVKNRCSRLVNFIKNRKLNNKKIEQLTRELVNGEMRAITDMENFYKTLSEPIKQE